MRLAHRMSQLTVNSGYSSLVEKVESYSAAIPYLRVSGGGDGVHMD